MIIILLSIFLSNIYAARGDLISAQFLGTKSIANNQTYVDNEIGNLTGQFSLDPVEYGYWMYKITYETIDVNGDVNIATGSIAYPRVDWPLIPNEAFPLISYQHGTVVERSSVTSLNSIIKSMLLIQI